MNVVSLYVAGNNLIIWLHIPLVLFLEYRTVKKRKGKDKRSQQTAELRKMEDGNLTIRKTNLVPFSIELHPNVITTSDSMSTADDVQVSPPKSPTNSASTNQPSSTLKRSKSMPKRRTSFRGQECSPS